MTTAIKKRHDAADLRILRALAASFTKTALLTAHNRRGYPPAAVARLAAAGLVTAVEVDGGAGSRGRRLKGQRVTLTPAGLARASETP